ncbi:MAG: M14 family zinc carboxypeptidase [Anaerovoracaceae bacterium]
MKITKKITIIMTAVLIMSLMPYQAFASDLVNEHDNIYTYVDMKRDIKELEKKYSEIFSSQSLGKTVDDRDIMYLTLGNKEASKQIIISASAHGREYINTLLVMETVEKILKNYNRGSYKGIKYKDLFNKISLHIVPMVNPDGVTISQKGYNGINDPALRKKAIQIGKGTSSRRWKANAQGVDLNRNWPVGFGNQSTPKPSPQSWSGPKAISAKENIALNQLIKSLPNPRANISFHCQGRIIYWDSKQKGDLRTDNYRLALVAKSINNYPLVKASSSYTFRGYFEDYAILKLKIPTLVIETGSGVAPLPSSHFPGIYKSNNLIMEAVAARYYR